MEQANIDTQILTTRFSEALIAPGPSAELGRHAEDLAWLVGGWSAIVRDYDDEGRIQESTGEWWFAWVLEGRALQDVWIVPPRTAAASKGRSRYGTTIRWLDHKAGMWNISWFNPVTGVHNDLAGRRYGNELIFEGATDGTPIRWRFSDITSSSFTWRGEDLSGGKAKLGSEFLLNRMHL